MTLKLRSLNDSQKVKGEVSHMRSFSFFSSQLRIFFLYSFQRARILLT